MKPNKLAIAFALFWVASIVMVYGSSGFLHATAFVAYTIILFAAGFYIPRSINK